MPLHGGKFLALHSTGRVMSSAPQPKLSASNQEHCASNSVNFASNPESFPNLPSPWAQGCAHNEQEENNNQIQLKGLLSLIIVNSIRRPRG